MSELIEVHSEELLELNTEIEGLREERNRLAAECRRLQEEVNQRREAMHAADTLIVEATAFLDRHATTLLTGDDWEVEGLAADCQEMARRLRGET